MGAVSTQALAADLSIVATPSPATQGSAVAVNVMLSGITDLYGYQFSLSFNPAVLQATGAVEGSFLSAGGTTFFDGGTIDNALGKVSFVFDTLVGAVPGVSGGGMLAKLNFTAAGVGISSLTFSDALLIDSALVDLPVQLVNGSLQVVAVPEPASMLLFALGLAGVAAARRRNAA